MTVIAWDGTTLAADKQGTSNGLRRTVTKIFRVRDVRVAVCGDLAKSLELLDWIKRGRDVGAFPDALRKNDECQCVVIENGQVCSYLDSPFPERFEDECFACGSGRDYAIAAMHCGKTAREAVEIACLYDNGCGMGVDTLDP